MLKDLNKSMDLLLEDLYDLLIIILYVLTPIIFFINVYYLYQIASIHETLYDFNIWEEINKEISIQAKGGI